MELVLGKDWWMQKERFDGCCRLLVGAVEVMVG